jgi:hypothetical protein
VVEKSNFISTCITWGGEGVKFINEIMFQKRRKLFNYFLAAIFEQ